MESIYPDHLKTECSTQESVKPADKDQCLKCCGEKVNKFGKKCKKCNGTGFIKTQLRDKLKEQLKASISEYVNTDECKQFIAQQIEN